jgi:laminin, gamma 1
LELIQTDGVAQLAKAKGKSNQFDTESELMSDISRNARKIADELEKTAENHRNLAKETKERAINASEKAKNTIDLQKSIDDKLNKEISPEFSKEQEKLEALKKLTAESLEKANSVFDDSLTLIAKVNSLPIPETDLVPIKEEAGKLSKDSDEIKNELDVIISTHGKLFEDVEDNIELSKVLLQR